MNRLFFGDNLEIMPPCLRDESVDLIYLDPPFNSNADYNVLFKSPSGQPTRAQRDAFEDTWRWDHSAQLAFNKALAIGSRAGRMLEALRQFTGDSDVMAYLAMMSVRLIEMRRVLKPTGSIFLHCDPTASHYLKLLMDSIFGEANFKNEIIWHYRKWSTGKYTFQRNHDVILFYARAGDKKRTFNQLYMERAASTLKRFGTKRIISGHDKEGRRVPSQTSEEESEGVRMDDVWDIGRVPPIKQIFPTQKPDALLKRIILAASNEGDVVLDPFCGCGTAIVMAQELKRKWIGIDIAYEAMMIIEARLKALYPAIKRDKDYVVEGVPKDETAAIALAKDKPYAFQAWAISLLRGGQPDGPKEAKKGKDRGIDGIIFFATGKRTSDFAVVSVKGGEKVTVDMVRALSGTMKREGAPLGIFLSLTKATKDMRAEAASESVEIAGRHYPRIQLCTVAELMEGRRPSLPPVYELSTLLNMPKALPVMRKVKPEDLRKQINLMLPIKGGVDARRPELPLEQGLFEPEARKTAKRQT